MKHKILIVDDEANIRSGFEALLVDEGHQVTTASRLAQARRLLEEVNFDLVLLDLSFPDESGLDLLKDVTAWANPVVLVVSGQSEISIALEAVRLGACDYLEKPVPPERLVAAVKQALLLARSRRHQRVAVDQIDTEARLVGESGRMKKLLATVGQVAPTDSTVLITGPNGTGKELVATRVFLQSARRHAPFIKVNCPGIPETLFESELFGHRKGSFTGAVKDYPGKFALADGGTIFLDEIGDLPPACQAKLLRVIENGQIDRLGEAESRHVDVRLICATNRDLPRLVSEQNFRQDLFYRISVFTIEVPELAARASDIPLLAAEFLTRFDPSGQTQLTPDALARLSAMPWPGNVRELKNLIERLVIFHAGQTVNGSQIDALAQSGWTAQDHKAGDDSPGLVEQLQQREQELIQQTLSQCNGNISEAARRLGVDRAHLSRKIKQLGLKDR